MSAEFIGVLSVGVALGVLIVALWRSTNARIERLEDQTNARFGRVDDRFERLEDQINARFERLEDRFETLDARQYEMAQALARIEARQIGAAATPESEGEPELVSQGTEAGRADQGR